MRSSELPQHELVYRQALRLMAGRDFTAAGLCGRLQRKGFADTDIACALERLKTEGWLDDRRFAERFTETSLGSGRYCGTRLRQEMRRRGVAPDLAAEVMTEALTRHDEAELLVTVLMHKFPGFIYDAAGDREKRRIVGYLQRRGFSLDMIFRAMRGAGH